MSKFWGWDPDSQFDAREHLFRSSSSLLVWQHFLDTFQEAFLLDLLYRRDASSLPGMYTGDELILLYIPFDDTSLQKDHKELL